MIGTDILHYRIEERLGEGGMGVVYRATDTKLGRQVALKFLPAFVSQRPEEKERFLKEARTASKLDHPNIATIYDVNEADGKIFYAMSLVDGVTLKSLRQQGPLTQKQIIEIAIQVADGLSHAHDRDIVHRDIKPQNIMVTTEGRPQILDFGLAKLGLEESRTGTTSTAGTAAYLSPEQAQGVPATPQSDLFSLGVVLYELVSGELPFKGDHPAALLYSVVHEDPPSLSSLAPEAPPALCKIIERLMAKDQANRFTSASELAARLRELARELEFSSFSGSLGTFRQEPRLGWRSVVFAVIALLILGIGTASLLDSGGEPAVAGDQYDVAVMYFDDLSSTDENRRVGEMVTELLITDLSRSPDLRVLSSQRLYDILKLLDREGQKQIDRTVASEIARKAQARNMITGSILKAGDRTRLTVNVIDVASGELLRAEQVEGEDLFTMVDSLSARVKHKLDVPVAPRLGDKSAPIATTRNAEAYLHYVQGLESYHSLNWEPAKAHFDSAIALDSNFSLAYLRAGIVAFSNNQVSAGYSYLSRGRDALEAGTLPPRESLLVASFSAMVENDITLSVSTLGRMQERFPDDKEAFFWQGNFLRAQGETQKSIRKLKRSLELDPTYPFPMLVLIDAYQDLDMFAEAISLAERYRNLRPDESMPRLMLGEMYMAEERYASARAEYDAALTLEPTSPYAVVALTSYFARQPDIDSLKALLEPFMTDTAAASLYGSSNALWAATLCLTGRFSEAIQQYRLTAELERRHGDSLRVAQHFAGLARCYLIAGMHDSARAVYERARLIYPSGMIYSSLPFQIELRSGNLERAKVERDSLLQRLGEAVAGPQIQTTRLALDGRWALETGDFAKALRSYRAAREQSGDPDDYSFSIGRACLETGEFEQARKELQHCIVRVDPIRSTESWVRAWYHLGRTHEALGNRGDALQAYKRFLRYWGRADRKLPEIRDARERLSELSAAS